MYQLEVPPQKSTVNDEDLEAFSTAILFMQMEELYDKLKLINHEIEFVQHFKIRPINRYVNAIHSSLDQKYNHQTWKWVFWPSSSLYSKLFLLNFY